ncbi:MAG: hypothetical protein J6S13_01460 [Clostridia bacterium]|nr:hypothetical protein [Clostridia bacterium]
MKRFLSFVLILVLCVFVCACGGSADSSGSSSSGLVSTSSNVSQVSTPDDTASVESYITVPDDFDYSKWMVMVNGKLYRGTSEDGPMGDSGCVEGRLIGTVKEGETPTKNGYSNFGITGSYTYDDDGRRMVFTPDGCWRWFEVVDEK